MAIPIAALAAAATAASGVGEAFAQYQGGREANAASRESVEEQTRTQKWALEQQMAFNERMSSTAYQRAMEDMRKAGLNPMLAYMQGGASSPSVSTIPGASYTAQNVLGPAVSRGVSSARDSALALGQLKAIDAQTDKASTESELNRQLVNQSKAKEALDNVSAATMAVNAIPATLRSKVEQRFPTIFGWLHALVEPANSAVKVAGSAAAGAFLAKE